MALANYTGIILVTRIAYYSKAKPTPAPAQVSF